MNNDFPHTNSLVNESSPYLLQHAHNPVDWYPWGDEALEKAKKEDKMLLVSIGYAACHWCHVMEHESFEDSLVAKIMNENFICIKVDREERPDVDDVYMTACQLASKGSCGWPLNAFALPDGKPVWAGTYFPKENWINILNQFKDLKEKDPDRLEKAAESITNGIANFGTIEPVDEPSDFTEEELKGVVEAYLSNFDFEKGGRIGAPKFPMPNNISFLLKYHYHTTDLKALDAATITLDNISKGGIYDQIGGGFARYSVDAEWKVPHFEKMLYDNGQLLGLYADAYALTKKESYLKIIEQSIDFIKRDLLDKSGGFYSSYDADSEGEEGTFYVWKADEIKQFLGNDYDLLAEYWNISDEGNWEGKNILFHTSSMAEFAGRKGIDIEQFRDILDKSILTLFQARETRIKPGLDDKILASWNGLMLSGLIKSYNAIQDPSILELALKNAHFIKYKLIDKNYRLDRNYKNGKATINGFLDDYANVIEAFIHLYEVTFDVLWLEAAENLNGYVQEHLYNSTTKMYNYTNKNDPALVAKTHNYSDNVIPSGNSTMARNLLKLGAFYNKSEYISKSKLMLSNVKPLFIDNPQPSFYSNWLQLFIEFIYPGYEVAIMGPNWSILRKEIAANYLPNVLLLGGDIENLPLLESKLVEEEDYIYVCQNKVCKLPVKSIGKALELIN